MEEGGDDIKCHQKTAVMVQHMKNYFHSVISLTVVLSLTCVLVRLHVRLVSEREGGALMLI